MAPASELRVADNWNILEGLDCGAGAVYYICPTVQIKPIENKKLENTQQSSQP